MRMFPRDLFDSYYPSKDIYERTKPVLVLDDLKPSFKGKPKLSILISTWNRKPQLSRTLECLARQEFRNFEVLIMDDGSTQVLNDLFDKFRPYLQIHTFRTERGSWHSCPSRAFKAMLPQTRGEVISILHPEIMLHPKATYYLYYGCKKPLKDAHYYTIDDSNHKIGKWYWTSLKPHFLVDLPTFNLLDRIDWHHDWESISSIQPNFWDIEGFAGRNNTWHRDQLEYPWWFAGSAKRDCPIWEHMPIIDGHGIIDMWFCSFRKLNKIVDVVPHQVLCLHQPHVTSAIAPEGEQESVKVEKIE